MFKIDNHHSNKKIEASIEVLDDGRYRPLSQFNIDGRTYIGPQAGETFQITIRNVSGKEIAFKISVGGIDPTTGNDADPTKGQMYRLGRGESVSVKSWMQGPKGGSALVFTEESMSVAAVRGKAGLPRDLIAIAVWEEGYQAPPTYSPPYAKSERGWSSDHGVLRSARLGARVTMESSSDARGMLGADSDMDGEPSGGNYRSATIEDESKGLGVGAGAFVHQEWRQVAALRDPKSAGVVRIWFKPYRLLLADLGRIARDQEEVTGFLPSPHDPQPGYADLGGVMQASGREAASDNEVQARWPRFQA